ECFSAEVAAAVGRGDQLDGGGPEVAVAGIADVSINHRARVIGAPSDVDAALAGGGIDGGIGEDESGGVGVGRGIGVYRDDGEDGLVAAGRKVSVGAFKLHVVRGHPG